MAALAVGVACGPPGPLCGQGTVLREGVCVSDTSARCGPGTELVQDVCLAIPTPGNLRCGVNTSLKGDSCEAAVVACGAGTVFQGGECRPTGTNVSCGPGTVLTGGECRPTSPVPGLSCGAGTAQVGTQCVAASASSATLAAFSANANLVGAHGVGPGQRATIITTFAQSQADAMVLSNAQPVGNGASLQVGAQYSGAIGSLAPGDFTTVAVAPLAGAACPVGQSDPAFFPGPFNQAFVLFREWSASTGKVKACGKAGSVRYERLPTGSVKVTFNVEFSDGTLWQDRNFVINSVGGY